MQDENSSIAAPAQGEAGQTSSNAQTSPARDASAKFEEKLAQARGIERPMQKAEATANDEAASQPNSVTNPGNGETKVGNNDEKPFRRERDNNRFGKLTKALKMREARIRELESQLGNLQKPKARAEYADDESYISDLSTHAANTKVIENELEANRSEQQREEREEWDERVRSTVKDVNSFMPRLREHIGSLDTETQEYAMSSPVGPRMLEFIFEQFANPDLKAQFVSMPKAKKQLLLVNLERECIAPLQQPAQRQEQAQPKVASLAPERGERVAQPATAGAKFEARLKQIRGL